MEGGVGGEAAEGDGVFDPVAAGEEFFAHDAGEESAGNGRGGPSAVDVDGDVGDGGFGELLAFIPQEDVVCVGVFGALLGIVFAAGGFVEEVGCACVYGGAGEGDVGGVCDGVG